MKKFAIIVFVFSYGLRLSAQSDYGRLLEIDFEVDTFDQYISFDTSANNIWQIGTPQKTFINSGLWDSKRCMMTDTVNNYPVNNYSAFTVSVHWPKIEEIDSPIISFLFYHKFDTDSAMDGGKIEVSFDGQDWYDLFWDVYEFVGYIDGSGHWYWDINDTAKSLNSTGFSGNISTWKKSIPHDAYEELALILDYPYNYDTVSFYLKFVFASDSIDNNKEGWAIDNIGIYYTNKPELDISEIQNNESYVLYPNPADGFLNLQTGESLFQSEVSYKIINARGQVTEEKSIDNFQDDLLKIYLNNYKPGIYFLMLLDKKRNIIRKFVIK
jgi:hypothetical protein